MKTEQKIDWLKWILIITIATYLSYSIIQALINLNANNYYLNL
jgi:hypothetical protein